MLKHKPNCKMFCNSSKKWVMKHNYLFTSSPDWILWARASIHLSEYVDEASDIESPTPFCMEHNQHIVVYMYMYWFIECDIRQQCAWNAMLNYTLTSVFSLKWEPFCLFSAHGYRTDCPLLRPFISCFMSVSLFLLLCITMQLPSLQVVQCS